MDKSQKIFSTVFLIKIFLYYSETNFNDQKVVEINIKMKTERIVSPSVFFFKAYIKLKMNISRSDL